MTTKKIKCTHCKKWYQKPLKYVNENRKLKRKHFCSHKCLGLSKSVNNIKCKCKQCKSPLSIKPSVYAQSNTKHFFCSSSCAALYNNCHKSHGYRRSKLEVFIENRLKKEYPKIVFLFNDKTTIESELDIVCPSLKLAIELNGIFHYEPIYGHDTLKRIINNDKQKMIRCYERGIELAVIDTSQHKYVTAKTCEKYYSIVKKLININLKRL